MPKLHKLTIALFLILYSTCLMAQNIPHLEVEGSSKFLGKMYISDSLDLSSIDIRNNWDPTMSIPLDSFVYYDNLYKQNTLIGGLSHDSSMLRSSTTVGFGAGYEQSGESNLSIGMASSVNSIGDRNIAVGAYAGLNTDGDDNIVIGNMAAPITGPEGPPIRNYTRNIIIGNKAGKGVFSGSRNIIIGHRAGPTDQLSNQLFIGTTGLSLDPLIGGSFSSMYVDINGALNVAENIQVLEGLEIGGEISNPSGDVRINDELVIRNDDGAERGLRLVEDNGANEFGFKMNYNGQKDRLELSTLGFSGNEGIRNIWTKNGNMGIGNITPLTSLHISNGSDAEIAGGGYLTIGSTTQNIVIDDNEIIARTSTNQPNKLYLNIQGEAVVLGSRLQLAYSGIDSTMVGNMGEIRYNKVSNDFEGFNGVSWLSLTNNNTSSAANVATNFKQVKALNPNITDDERKNKALENRIAKLEHVIEQLLIRLD